MILGKYTLTLTVVEGRAQHPAQCRLVCIAEPDSLS